MSQKENEASDDALIQGYLENEATPAEELLFRQRLGEEAFRRRVAEQAIDLTCLYEQGREGKASPLPPAPALYGRRRVLAVALVAASLLIAFGTVGTRIPRNEDTGPMGPDQVAAKTDRQFVGESSEGADGNSPTTPETKPVIGHVANVIGHVLTADSLDSSERRVVTREAEFHSGDLLQTVGAESFAVLKFDDNSVLAVAGDTRLSCSTSDAQKRVVVREGDLLAQVAPQPGTKPMLIETPVARAEVLGTTLSLFASLVITELAVMEGQVRLQRLADDQVVDVNEGESAVATKDVTEATFAAKPISPVSSVWEEDFEEQWPKRWRAGHWVNYGLPPGSLHAARAEVTDPDDGHAFIITGNEWSAGLFRIEDDTHVNLTYKLNLRGWFYLRIDTKTAEHKAAYSGNYFFRSPKLWNVPLHQWRTVSIPLSEFYKSQQDENGGETRISPQKDDVVFCLLLRTQKPDPELFVDRIWVTKGPAEGALVLKSPPSPR